MKKRIVSLLLCLCMVFSLLPTVVLTEGESVESNQTSGEVCQGVIAKQKGRLFGRPFTFTISL